LAVAVALSQQEHKHASRKIPIVLLDLHPEHFLLAAGVALAQLHATRVTRATIYRHSVALYFKTSL